MQDFTFTTTSGRTFTAVFAHGRYFKVNDFMFKLETSPKALKLERDITAFLKTIGASGKADRVFLNLTDTDYAAMANHCATVKAEAEAAHEAYLETLPIQYRLTYSGWNADGDMIPTKVEIEKFRRDGDRYYPIITRKWDNDLMPVPEALAMAETTAADTGTHYGWWWMELTTEQAQELAARFDAADAEKKANTVTTTPPPKTEYQGVHIEYGDDHELWDGIRMD